MKNLKFKNMNITKKKYEDVGSCNFCAKGKIDDNGLYKFPYTYVYEISGNTINTRVCEECLHELRKILNSYAPFESRSVTDNEQAEKKCQTPDICIHRNIWGKCESKWVCRYEY
jgi:hypothetical protein